MRNPIPLFVFTMLIGLTPAQADDPPAEPHDANAAVCAGLAYVETKSMAWLHEHECASCHHVPMMVWCQREARERGFTIDEAGLQEATDFLLAADNRADIVPNPEDPPREGNPYSLMAAVTTLAFRESGDGIPPGTEEVFTKAATHLLASQGADGAWLRFEGRPPIMAIQEDATLLAEYSLGAAPPAGDPTEAGRTRTREWLAANSPGETQQALSYRIVVDYERQASVEMLLSRQNADGGWSQTQDMASDAYATGQAIYALVSRGGIDPQHPAIIKARDFLVSTQNADGSWTMTSRPPNNGGDVDGAGNLEPITVAGSAWAVLGLLQVTDGTP